MNTAFLSVAFPAALKWLPDFLNSLAAQEDQDFTLLLGLDELAEERVDTSALGGRVEFVDVTGLSVAANRFHLIELASQRGFELAIFGDSDDHFSANRVGVTRRVMSEHAGSIIVNELAPFADGSTAVGEGYLKRRLLDAYPPNPLVCNFMGFTNTAIDLRSLKMPAVPGIELMPVDWYFFLNLILDGYRLQPVMEITSHYRQHGANSVGIGAATDADFVIGQRAQIYSSLAPRLGETATRLLGENKRSAANQSGREHPLWWENPPLGSAVENPLSPRSATAN